MHLILPTSTRGEFRSTAAPLDDTLKYIAHRRVVPAAELAAHFWMEQGLEPIYHRALVEAGLS